MGGGGVSASASLGGDADADGDTTRNADGYTEGIPGPVTRLVVLANRGLANLVQDLILVRHPLECDVATRHPNVWMLPLVLTSSSSLFQRVAATSEKFVNFKAKLITALI